MVRAGFYNGYWADGRACTSLTSGVDYTLDYEIGCFAIQHTYLCVGEAKHLLAFGDDVQKGGAMPGPAKPSSTDRSYLTAVTAYATVLGSKRQRTGLQAGLLDSHLQKERKEELCPWGREFRLSSAKLLAWRLPGRAAGWATVGTAPNQASKEGTTVSDEYE